MLEPTIMVSSPARFASLERFTTIHLHKPPMKMAALMLKGSSSAIPAPKSDGMNRAVFGQTVKKAYTDPMSEIMTIAKTSPSGNCMSPAKAFAIALQIFAPGAGNGVSSPKPMLLSRYMMNGTDAMAPMKEPTSWTAVW